MIGHATNEGVGAAQSKTGDMATPLNREMGMSATMGAVGSKTRSPHNASGSQAYDYVDPPTSYGDDKICGYSPGNGGSGECPEGTYP
jgi:hypothetical protein